MDNPTIHTFSVLFKMVFHFLVKLPVTSTLYEVLDVYCYIPVQRIAFHCARREHFGDIQEDVFVASPFAMKFCI